MTTITSFLNNNFIEATEDSQTPLWCLSLPSGPNYEPIKTYFINNCVQNNKPLIHIDLGISTVQIVSQCQPVVKIEDKILYQPKDNKPYYILRYCLKQKANEMFFNKFISIFNNLIANENVSSLFKKYKKIGLLIEGIESVYLLNKSKSSLEHFFIDLNNISKLIGQITVLIRQNLLPFEVLFTLERTSSCLTKLLPPNQNNVFQCISTARRLTGFSNHQNYIISIKQGKAKVEKKTKVHTSSNQSYQTMVQQLGFVPNNQLKTEKQTIKNMIFPHLNMQYKKQECKQPKENCVDCQCKEKDQGLIILDDEQQDDDDIDV